MARARTLATQTGTDASQSSVIDNLGGFRAGLDHAIREVYRRKANDQKFLRDICVTHDITMTSGEGAIPDEVMRELLHQAEFQDDVGSLISYMTYAIDAQSETLFNQLGYTWLVGDTLHYLAPDGADYSGSLAVTVPSFPEFPDSMEDNIPMTSATAEDVILLLSQMISG